MKQSGTLPDPLAQCQSLRPVPMTALKAYRDAVQPLIGEVTERMIQHPRFQELLGGNSPMLFADNHRNHALFMEEVLGSGHYRLLASTLPWVYHAYHAHGVHYDYFVIELGLWKQAIAAALPADAAVPILAIYDWMIACHDQVIALAEERGVQGDEPSISADWSNLFEALTEALLAGDDGRVLALCRGAQGAGATLPDLLQGLIYPAMKRIGTLWESGRISVADEHQTTAIMNRVLAALYFEQTFPDLGSGRALVAACVNEYHEMGAWMVASCLELDGWDVDYLGANVPTDDLVAKAEEIDADLIALSVSMPFSLRATREIVTILRERLPRAKILVGGHVFQLLPALAADVGADAYLPDCEAAMRWARDQFGHSDA